MSTDSDHNPGQQQLLLNTLEQLLELSAVDLRTAMNQATQLVVEALKADKVDVFMLDPAKNVLRAVGTSDTPLGQLQVAQGLDVMPITNGGSVVQVYQTGAPFLHGHIDQVAGELPGVVHALGIRSHIAVVLEVAGDRRGVLSVQSKTREFFGAEDLRFVQAVSHWVGEVAHRAELVEASTAAARLSGRREVAEELILILAHDLRNYLGTIKLHVEILKQRAVNEDQSVYVRDADHVLRVVDRLTRLVVDLLDVERLEQGMFALQPAPVDFMELAHETAQALGNIHIDVQVSGPPSLMLSCDGDRIRQTLENLIGNAIKHSPKGKPVLVKVHTETNHDAMPQLIAEVSDQGPGVAPEVLPYLFERFTRAGGAQGLGLGLYLANRIATAHGGALTVSSAPGSGARFQLMLPIEGPPPSCDELTAAS